MFLEVYTPTTRTMSITLVEIVLTRYGQNQRPNETIVTEHHLHDDSGCNTINLVHRFFCGRFKVRSIS